MKHLQNVFLLSTTTVVVILLVPFNLSVFLLNYLVPILLFGAISILLLIKWRKPNQWLFS